MTNGLDEFDNALIRALKVEDVASAAEIVRAAIEGGRSAANVVDTVITPAQRHIGDLWEAGQITVSMEHRATSICEDMVELALGLSPPRQQVDARVLIVTSPGEWHRLGCSAIGGLLASAGARTLRPALPASPPQLIAVLHDVGPDAIVLSCSMPANLAQIASVAAVALEARVPVILGGRAITPSRLDALGLHSASSLDELLDKLVIMDVAPPIPLDPEKAARAEAVHMRLHELGAQMVAELQDADYNGDPVTDAVWLLRSFSSSVVCDEPEIISVQADWQDRRHDVAGVAPSGLLGRALAVAVKQVIPDELAWLESALTD